jgi:hypothetical protein
MQVDRRPISSHQPGDPPDVVHVRVGEDDGLRLSLPGLEERRDPVRLRAGIDDDDVFARPHEEAVSLERPNRNCANL